MVVHTLDKKAAVASNCKVFDKHESWFEVVKDGTGGRELPWVDHVAHPDKVYVRHQ